MVGVFNEVLGREVSIADRPARIVSLSPAITETLFLLGLGERVIGVSAFCARPDEARQRRKVGSYSTTNRDLLRELKPDLILSVTGYQRDLALALSSEFPSYPIALPISVAGIIDTVIKVGLVTGEPEKGWSLSSELIRKAATFSRIQKRLKVYVEIDLGGPVSFGAHSYITDAFHFFGASTLFDQARSEWLTPNLVEVSGANPDVLIYEAKMYSKFGQHDLELLWEKRGWRRLECVRKENYFLTPGPLDFLAHHGPSFINEAIPWISAKLSSVADTMGWKPE